MNRLKALAQHLEINAEEIHQTAPDTFEVGSEEYLVLTDAEADKATREQIVESLWAFQPEFLAAHSDVDAEDFKTIQDNGKCESNNKLIKKLINDFDHFVNDAVLSDGRGHFLSGYDSEENEVDQFFIYRRN